MRERRRDDSIMVYKNKSDSCIVCRFCVYNIYPIIQISLDCTECDDIICCSHSQSSKRWTENWNFNNNRCEIITSFNNNICLLKLHNLCTDRYTCLECKLLLPSTKEIAMKNILNVDDKTV